MKNSHKLILILTILTSTPAFTANPLPAHALYRAVLPKDPHPKMVDTVEIAVDIAPGRPKLHWYRLTYTKVSDDLFTIWFLADTNPFTASPLKAVHFYRYILQEPQQSPIEYIDQRSGRALVPLFNFSTELLPRSDANSNELLFEKGSFLGHPLIRRRILESQPVAPPENITKLILNPDLLIGTGRNFRDDGTGRKSKRHNYNFVTFTKKNYDDMIASGFNYFIAKGEQIEWICRKPVFYEGRSPTIAFPEELYRSNFMGISMFIDEPACILAGQYPRNATSTQAIEMIHKHILEKRNNQGYRVILLEAGIDLGSLKLIEPAVPIWETYVGTCYYQLEAYPYGFIQECRWRIHSGKSDRGQMLQRINNEFGTNIPVEPRNLFLWYYYQMRGPARAFNARWGMAIYGQAEPDLRLPSMKLAYDLGAAFMWFWTSDHDHHVPYTEQLALASAITDYAKSHPRGPLDKLLRQAKTAIVLPYGYTLPSSWELNMFGSYIFPMDRKNRLGITYKQLLTPAIKEIEYCLRQNIPYDVVPAGKDFDSTSYNKVIWIREDGTVRISKKHLPSAERHQKP